MMEIALPAPLVNMLKSAAKTSGRSINAEIVAALYRALRKPRAPRPTTPQPNLTAVTDKYLSSSEVCSMLGGITSMTLWRWLRDDGLAFPKPMQINRRRLFLESEVVAWVISRKTLDQPAPARKAS